MTGGALYGLGVFLTSFSHNLTWLYFSYGLIGGLGLGLGYIVPVTVLVKWFPDLRGLIRDFTLGEALKTWQWWALWLVLFLNTCAGMSIISQEAPLFQEETGVTAAVAASMVGLASVGNVVGRVFWAWVSDLVTRRATFSMIFAGQFPLFWFLPNIATAWFLTVVTFVVLMCYRVDSVSCLRL